MLKALSQNPFNRIRVKEKHQNEERNDRATSRQ